MSVHVKPKPRCDYFGKLDEPYWTIVKRWYEARLVDGLQLLMFAGAPRSMKGKKE